MAYAQSEILHGGLSFTPRLRAPYLPPYLAEHRLYGTHRGRGEKAARDFAKVDHPFSLSQNSWGEDRIEKRARRFLLTVELPVSVYNLSLGFRSSFQSHHPVHPGIDLIAALRTFAAPCSMSSTGLRFGAGSIPVSSSRRGTLTFASKTITRCALSGTLMLWQDPDADLSRRGAAGAAPEPTSGAVVVRTGCVVWRLRQQPPNYLPSRSDGAQSWATKPARRRAPLLACRRGGYRWMRHLTSDLTNRPLDLTALSDHLPAFTAEHHAQDFGVVAAAYNLIRIAHLTPAPA